MTNGPVFDRRHLSRIWRSPRADASVRRLPAACAQARSPRCRFCLDDPDPGPIRADGRPSRIPRPPPVIPSTARSGMFLDSLMGFFSTDVAMDLGTANTLVYVRGRGIVLNEPSVVAVDKASGSVLAVGSEAKLMLARTPDAINAIRPLKDGVIADFEVTEDLLREFVLKVQKHKFLVRPRIIICVPSGITEVEKRAVIDSAVRAGCREPVLLVPEPIAAAIGVGL